MSFCRLISRELDIYDKNSRCIMTEGEYELLLSEQQQAVTNGDTSSSIKNGTWESVSNFKSIPSPNNLCTQSTDQSKLIFLFSPVGYSLSMPSSTRRPSSFVCLGATRLLGLWWSALDPSCPGTTPRTQQLSGRDQKRTEQRQVGHRPDHFTLSPFCYFDKFEQKFILSTARIESSLSSCK